MSTCFRADGFRADWFRAAALSLALVGSTGCGRSLVGVWRGTCEAGFGADEFEMDMILEIDELKSRKVSGGGAFQYLDYTFVGALTGEYEDESMDADIVGVTGGYTITTRVLVERADDQLEGICAFEDQGELIEGEVDFDRD